MFTCIITLYCIHDHSFHFQTQVSRSRRRMRTNNPDHKWNQTSLYISALNAMHTRNDTCYAHCPKEPENCGLGEDKCMVFGKEGPWVSWAHRVRVKHALQGRDYSKEKRTMKQMRLSPRLSKPFSLKIHHKFSLLFNFLIVFCTNTGPFFRGKLENSWIFQNTKVWKCFEQPFDDSIQE